MTKIVSGCCLSFKFLRSPQVPFPYGADVPVWGVYRFSDYV